MRTLSKTLTYHQSDSHVTLINLLINHLMLGNLWETHLFANSNNYRKITKIRHRRVVTGAPTPRGTAAGAPNANGSTTSGRCDHCPAKAVAPVCAEMLENGVSVTVAHNCFAECQGMVNIRPGSCEDLLEGETYTALTILLEINILPGATLP